VSELVEGLSNLGNPTYWLAFSAAVVMAVLVGLIPGVSATLVMALSISFVVINISDPLIGIVMLATLTGVDNTLDSIPAILLGQPGASTQVTFLEGNQLARQGLAAHTLGAVYAVSAIGGVVGAVTLAIIIPVIKPFILSFGFPEIAMMALFGVAMVAGLSTGAVFKGFAAAAMGLLIGTIGIDPISGAHRYTFGTLQLWEGLPLIATTIGLFALPEMVDLTMTRNAVAHKGAVVSQKEVFRGVRYGLSKWKISIRHGLFGVFLGAVPGIGGAVVDWLSYALGVFLAKDKTGFGKGNLDGVLFAESAQNSKEGGQAIPTLAFGVPGGRAWAFVIVAMLAYGIAPGPPMLGRHADITIMMVVSLGLGNLAVTIIGMFMTGQLAKLTLIPYPFIAAIIIPVSFMSAFLSVFDMIAIPIIIAGAMMGLMMKQFKWPRPPMLLGFILGPIIETNFQSAVSIHGLFGLMTRPLTIVLFVLALGTAITFSKMAGVSAAAQEDAGGERIVSGAGPAAGSRFSPARLRQLRFSVTPASLFTMLVIAGSVAFFIGALDYPARGRLFPMTLSGLVVALAVVQLVFDSLKMKTGDIMDIGMRSAGMEGARRTGFLVGGILAVFVALIYLIGLKWATMLFPLAITYFLLEGKARKLGMPIAFVFVIAFNLILMDRIMAVIWPEPVIGFFSTGGGW
jgi:TctA family transporter